MAFYKTFSIPMGYEATLTADEFLTVGIYGRVAQPGSGTQYAPSELSASATAVVGPFNEDREYFLSGDNGDITVAQVYSGIFTQDDDDGDVEGPASATDNALVRFDATTGKLIQDSGVIVSDANAMTGVASIVANGNIAAGKSGTAGTISSFPATASKGSLKLVGVANTGNTDVTISNAAMGQASVVSVPDPGAATGTFALKEINNSFTSSQTIDVGDATGLTINTNSASARGLRITNTSGPGLITMSDASGELTVTSGTGSAGTGTGTYSTIKCTTGGLILSDNTAVSLTSLGGNISLNNALRTLKNLGTANTGTTAVEYGDGYQHTTVLTVNTTLPAIAGGADLSVGKLLYTLPAGAIIVDKAYMSMAITQTQGNITADTPDVGLGTTIAAGANALLSDTAGAENILTGQTANDCDGTAEVKTVADQILVIEAAGDHTIYFNAADGWAASGDAAALLTGTVVIHWQFMA